jgi:hypothetical protein
MYVHVACRCGGFSGSVLEAGESSMTPAAAVVVAMALVVVVVAVEVAVVIAALIKVGGYRSDLGCMRICGSGGCGVAFRAWYQHVWAQYMR